MKFKIDILIDLSPDTPGMLVPIFKIDGSNLPYVQEMNDSFEVYDMQPYILADSYEYTIPVGKTETDIGEKGVIAFRSFDNSIFTGTLSEVLAYRDKNLENIASVALLDLQLARVCGEPIAALYDKMRRTSETYFDDKTARSWVAGELALQQKNRGIWDNINSLNSNKEDNEEFLIKSNQHSFEYLFRWLTKNIHNKNWNSVWLRAFKINPFDERMSMIAREWLTSRMNDGYDIAEIKVLLYSYLECRKIFPTEDDFPEVLTEYLSFRMHDMFEILQPVDFSLLIFNNLKYDEDYYPFCNSLHVYIKERLYDDPRYSSVLSSIDAVIASNLQ